jgi:hypothetical protein
MVRKIISKFFRIFHRVFKGGYAKECSENVWEQRRFLMSSLLCNLPGSDASVAKWPKFRPKRTKSGLTKKGYWKDLRPNFTKREEKGQRKF